MAKERKLDDLLGVTELQDSIEESKFPDSMMAQCERSEAWLFPEQYDDLDRLVKSLKRKYPPPKGYRFTRNALYRVAVALLLANKDKLRGSTDAELFRSLDLELPTRPNS